MTKRDLQRFKKLIEDERLRVVQKLGMIEEEIQGLNSRESGNQSYSNHMADIGSDAMEQEQAFLHASQGTDYLIALEEALRRVETSRRRKIGTGGSRSSWHRTCPR